MTNLSKPLDSNLLIFVTKFLLQFIQQFCIARCGGRQEALAIHIREGQCVRRVKRENQFHNLNLKYFKILWAKNMITEFIQSIFNGSDCKGIFSENPNWIFETKSL